MWTPDRGAPPRSLLIVQTRRLGDAVLVSPTLDALARAWPDTRVHGLLSPGAVDLYAGDPRWSLLWPRPTGRAQWALARRVRAEGFDLVFDFQSLPATAALARATGGYTVGFARGLRGRFYHRRVNVSAHRGSGYAADHKLDFLRVLGIEAKLTPPSLPPAGADRSVWEGLPDGPRVVVVPVSLREYKRWSARGYAETARILHRETGAVFVVAGGPGEEPALAAVADVAGDLPMRTHVVERPRDWKALFAGARLYLGNDNGLRHVAMAVGLPTLAWFGRNHPRHWTPPGDPRHAVFRTPRTGTDDVPPDLHLIPDRPDTIASTAAALLAGAPSPA